jgi:hypothetical protein
MGLTQHRSAVATIREIVNFLLIRGNIGRPGTGPSPIRGHSNVQGDRTMGIWEKMPDSFLDRLGEEFHFEPPRAHGRDTVETIRAMRDGAIDVFFALGGTFVAGARRDETQPFSPAPRRRSLDLAVPRALGTRRPGDGRTIRHGGGFNEHGARVAGSARPWFDVTTQ